LEKSGVGIVYSVSEGDVTPAPPVLFLGEAAAKTMIKPQIVLKQVKQLK
jgi:hypothetical protein